MIQPINGRLLVKVTDSQFKHVKLNSDKQHQLAPSTGVVLAVADDLELIIKNVYKLADEQVIGTLPVGKQWVGKSIRWEKYAEQNALFEMDDPDQKNTKIKVALIEYKDITSYEC